MGTSGHIVWASVSAVGVNAPGLDATRHVVDAAALVEADPRVRTRLRVVQDSVPRHWLQPGDCSLRW